MKRLSESMWVARMIAKFKCLRQEEKVMRWSIFKPNNKSSHLASSTFFTSVRRMLGKNQQDMPCNKLCKSADGSAMSKRFWQIPTRISEMASCRCFTVFLHAYRSTICSPPPSFGHIVLNLGQLIYCRKIDQKQECGQCRVPFINYFFSFYLVCDLRNF